MIKRTIFSLDSKNKKVIFLFFLLISAAGFFCSTGIPAQATHVDSFSCTPTGPVPANATECPKANDCIQQYWECTDAEYAYQTARGNFMCNGVTVCSKERWLVSACSAPSVAANGQYICNAGYHYALNAGVPYCAPNYTMNLTINGVVGPLAGKYPGDPLNIVWMSTGLTNCTASGAGWTGPKDILGNETINASVTSTYTLACYDLLSNPVSGSVTVNVIAPTITFTASPAGIIQGASSSTLTWIASGFTSCTLSGDGSSEDVSPSGNKSVSPAFTATYRLTCPYYTGGSTYAETTVTVSCPSKPPSDWGECDKPCGGGTQIQTWYRPDCTSFTKSQECNTQSCSLWKEVAP